jgi:UrcA family protein
MTQATAPASPHLPDWRPSNSTPIHDIKEMQNMFRRIPSALVSGLALLSMSQASQAHSLTEGYTEVGRVVVSFGDLDLDREADAAVLLERLNAAAYEACGGDPRWNSKYRLMPNAVRHAYKECRGGGRARARRGID